jgi:hypothetical protein
LCGFLIYPTHATCHAHLIRIPFPLPRSFQRIHQIRSPYVSFRNKLVFNGEGFLASRPTPKLNNCPLSAVLDCLFIIFATTLHIWLSNAPFRYRYRIKS